MSVRHSPFSFYTVTCFLQHAAICPVLEIYLKFKQSENVMLEIIWYSDISVNSSKVVTAVERHIRGYLLWPFWSALLSGFIKSSKYFQRQLQLSKVRERESQHGQGSSSLTEEFFFPPLSLLLNIIIHYWILFLSVMGVRYYGLVSTGSQSIHPCAQACRMYAERKNSICYWLYLQ